MMVPRLASVGLLFCLSFGQGRAQAAPTTLIQSGSISPLTDREAILPLAKAGMLIHHYLGSGRRDRITSWVPASQDLRDLQAAYTAIIFKVGLPDPAQGLHRTDVTLYYRQYVPIVENGKRLILIRGLSPSILGAGGLPPSTSEMNAWRTSEDIVFDGGRDVFHALYDCAERKIVLFIFNGK